MNLLKLKLNSVGDLNMRCFDFCAMCAVCAVLVGCSDPAPTPEAVESTVVVPASFFTPDRPGDVSDLKAVRDSAAKGDTVTFLARVGGRVRPFIKTQAIFVVTDPKLESCEMMHMQNPCKVPWDYCCEDPDALKVNVATVRFLDEGKPIRTSAKGAGGLEEAQFVVVSGTVNDINDEGLFVVDATQVWVGGKPEFGKPRLGSGE
jgi:hypothetical protein